MWANDEGESCLHSIEGVGEVVTINCIPNLIFILLNAAFSFAGVTALAFIIFGAYKMIFSGGDPKQLEGARHTITYAILGLVLVFLSYFIVAFIGEITGVTCIQTISFGDCS